MPPFGRPYAAVGFKSAMDNAMMYLRGSETLSRGKSMRRLTLVHNLRPQ
jgi:hypothetical protein